MRIPRNLSAKDFIKYMNEIGYIVTRQKGSHIRLSRTDENSTHHITIPNQNPLKVGTLNSILNDLSDNLKISKEVILQKLTDLI